MTNKNAKNTTLAFYIENDDLYKLKCISRDKNMSFQDFINSILLNKINEEKSNEEKKYGEKKTSNRYE